MNSIINVRVDEGVKKQSSEILKKIGLDMSTAVNLFLRQVIVEKELPFIPSANAKKIRARWDRQAAEAMKRPGYKTAQELHKSIIK